MFCEILLAALLTTKPIEPVCGYIYLGDSRFVGMNNACDIDEEENTWVVAKVGEGLKWCEDTAMPEIEKIVEGNKDIDDWYIVSGLGVNDSYNIDNYLEFYATLDDYNLILVSVNPMDKAKCDKWGYDYHNLTVGANKFNRKIKQSDYVYIDISSYLSENGFTTVDGVHYTDNTYEVIYERIREELNKYETTEDR